MPLVEGNENHPYALGCASGVWLYYAIDFINIILLMTAVNQSEFARMLGFSSVAVTKLKNAGRLVFTEDGLVDVEASKKRIEETSDPRRDDVVRRNAEERGSDPGLLSQSPVNASFQESRAMKEQYLALQAKADYETRMGELVERTTVERDWMNVAVILRTSLEKIPDSMAAVLAGESDIDRVHAMLTEQIEQALKQASDHINRLQ